MTYRQFKANRDENIVLSYNEMTNKGLKSLEAIKEITKTFKIKQRCVYNVLSIQGVQLKNKKKL